MHLNTQKLFRELKDDRGSDRGVGRRLRDTIVSPASELFKRKATGEKVCTKFKQYLSLELSSD